MKENINININAHLRRVITQFSESKIQHYILSAHKNYIFHPIKILNLAPGSYFCREGGSTIIPSNHKQIYCKFNQNQQDKPNRTNGYQNHLKTTCHCIKWGKTSTSRYKKRLRFVEMNTTNRAIMLIKAINESAHTIVP
jgi:hypothetical protein